MHRFSSVKVIRLAVFIYLPSNRKSETLIKTEDEEGYDLISDDDENDDQEGEGPGPVERTPKALIDWQSETSKTMIRQFLVLLINKTWLTHVLE